MTLSVGLTVWLALAGTALAAGSGSLDVTIDHASRTLSGMALWELELTPGAAFPLFVLAKDGAVESVTVNGHEADHALDEGYVDIDGRVPEPVDGASLTRVVIRYSCIFDDPFPVEPYAMDNPGFGVAATITDNAAFLLAGSGWYPRPVGVGSTMDRGVEITVRAAAEPRPIWAVTQGELVGHDIEKGQAVSRWAVRDGQSMVRGLTLMAGPYAVQRRAVELAAGESEALTYFTEPLADLADTYLDAVESHLRYYDALHGAYAFPKFAVVENFFPTGYGMASMTVLGRRVLALPFIPATSLRHEVAHCWWGNGVYVNYAKGNWCEGLATYVADHRRDEEQGPDAARDYRLRNLRRFVQVGAHTANLSLNRFTSRTSPETQAIGYGKAMFVFHMARRLLGDEPFYAALAEVYRDKLFQEAEWEDFRAAFVRHGMGEGLSRRFMDQWVTRAGGPALSVEDVAVRREGDGYAVTGAVLQRGGGGLYRLALPVRVSTAEGAATAVLPISSERTPFTLTTTAPPVRLEADPDVDLFRVLDPAEIPPSVNDIKGAEALVVIVSDQLPDPFLDLGRKLAASLSQPGAAVLRETEAVSRKLDTTGLLFLGWPVQPGAQRLLPELQASVNADPVALVLGGEAMPLEADTVFLAGTRPDGVPGGVIWTAPNAAKARFEAIARASLKLTHYGRYGYLAFDQGANVLKGEFPPPATPLTIDLTGMEF